MLFALRHVQTVGPQLVLLCDMSKLIVAFDIKLVPTQLSVDMAWSVEANYLLPMNDTEYSYPPIIPVDSSRMVGIFDRAVLYKLVETKLKSFTKIHEGRNCLLRIICEMTLYSTKDTDVLGDLLHILLSPSSSVNSNLPLEYSQAEAYGNKNKHCKKYTKKCSTNFLDYISVFANLLDHVFED
ncbi:uncharacterized protein [Euwallacea fornicatus]|uniref:uncharacterized protein isoform X2 n=1 Tax=Euwallacea fornicatus TaxID=995702 RepID=UPI00338DC3D9